jgi:hypothetical protein
VLTLLFDDDLCLFGAVEDFSIEHPTTQLAVEAFAMAVIQGRTMG